jgi:ATP/maltotriose-dependent transcriptional regulator MalT
MHGDGVNEPGVWDWPPLLADALVGLGRLQEAEEALTPYEALAAQRQRASALVKAARVRGILEIAMGRPGDAENAFRAGLSHAATISMPFDRALLELAFGAFLRRAGKRRAAVALLSAAQDRLTALDARPFLKRCHRELAACGLEPGKRSGRNIGKLTPQEAAVAQLVASGLSNREVAANLVVSVNTVEFHLRNIFTKLGVSSRTQLATRVA